MFYKGWGPGQPIVYVKPRINKGRGRAASGPCSEPACHKHCYPLRPAWRPALINRTPG
jgi:hypothetical protein